MQKLKQVVSANYLDRESKFKWLMRNENDYPRKALPFKYIKATDVEFRGSNAMEEGFGCSRVAFCAKAEGYDFLVKPEDLRQLKFDGYDFLDSESFEKVERVSYLYLDNEGKMFYLPVAVEELVEEQVVSAS